MIIKETYQMLDRYSHSLFDFLHLHKQQSLLFSLVYTFLAYLPDTTTHIGNNFETWKLACAFIYILFLYSSWIYLICKIVEWLKNVYNVLFSITHTLLHLFFYVYFFSSWFLQWVFGLRWNAFTIELVAETNSQETSEFLMTYVFTYKTAALVVLTICLLFSEIMLLRKKWIYRLVMPNGIVSTLYILAAIASLTELRYFCSDREPHSMLEKSRLYSTYISIERFNSYKQEYDVCAKSQDNISIETADFSAKNIVLIIGESHSKHHSQLYGYQYETNPLLSKLQGLYTFDNVISKSNGTARSFRYFLSFSSNEDCIRWCDTPLLPAVFKNAGYNVVLYSNQYVLEGEQEVYVPSGGFLLRPNISEKMVTNRNHAKYPYDGLLLDDYKAHRKDIEADSLNLIIFHLYGQHVRAKERYPKGEAYFKTLDYHRPDLTTPQIQEVAEYDNATRYNDKIVSSIIDMYKEKETVVVYFSDHGEEVYDYRAHIGRSSNYEDPQVLRYQFEIPFFIYVSPLYAEKHYEVVERIQQSVHRPFMTDKLPHLLLGLAGIHIFWYDERCDLLSRNYDVHRKRVIENTLIDYDTAITKVKTK